MLNKSLNEKHLEMYLIEVKEAMKSSCTSADILDSKTHSLIKIIISVFFGLSAIIFIHNQDKKILVPAIILAIEVGLSLFILCLGYMSSNYHFYGEMMKDLENEHGYYHDEKGMLVYLIQIYQMKTQHNVSLNDKKAKYIDASILLSAISSILASGAYLFF
jgi:hypothetical protein